MALMLELGRIACSSVEGVDDVPRSNGVVCLPLHTKHGSATPGSDFGSSNDMPWLFVDAERVQTQAKCRTPCACDAAHTVKSLSEQ